jgi:hypothetical protein
MLSDSSAAQTDTEKESFLASRSSAPARLRAIGRENKAVLRQGLEFSSHIRQHGRIELNPEVGKFFNSLGR